MKAVHLRTEYMKNPVGIDIAVPRLFWHCDGGKRQTAYQIIAWCDGLQVWNTGKAQSSRMTHIARRRGLQLPRPLARAATLAVVGVGWVLFREQDMAQAAELLIGLFSAWSPAGVSVTLQTVGAVGLAQLVLTLLVYRLLPEQWPEYRSERTAPVLFYTLLLTGIAWLGLAASGQQSAFLYFQF